MSQTRYHATLDPADARRLRRLAASGPLSPSDWVRLAVLKMLREREQRQPVARLPMPAPPPEAPPKKEPQQ